MQSRKSCLGYKLEILWYCSSSHVLKFPKTSQEQSVTCFSFVSLHPIQVSFHQYGSLVLQGYMYKVSSINNPTKLGFHREHLCIRLFTFKIMRRNQSYCFMLEEHIIIFSLSTITQFSHYNYIILSSLFLKGKQKNKSPESPSLFTFPNGIFSLECRLSRARKAGQKVPASDCFVLLLPGYLRN